MPPPTLPRLPVPALATTFNTFLRLVRPITSADEYKEAEMVRVSCLNVSVNMSTSVGESFSPNGRRTLARLSIETG
jgi:hypothetical protein